MDKNTYRNTIEKIKVSDKKINETYEYLCNYKTPKQTTKSIAAPLSLIAACVCICFVLILLINKENLSSIFKHGKPTESPYFNTTPPTTDIATPEPTYDKTPDITETPSPTPTTTTTITPTPTQAIDADAPVLFGFQGFDTDHKIKNENNPDTSKAKLTVTSIMNLPSGTDLSIGLVIKNPNNYTIKEIVLDDSQFGKNIVFTNESMAKNRFKCHNSFDEYLNVNINRIELIIKGAKVDRTITVKEITYLKDDNTEKKVDLSKAYSLFIEIKHIQNQYFECVEYPDGSYVINKRLTNMFPETFTLPTEINGKPISGIICTFSGTNIKNLIIPSSYTSLPDGFLFNCANLESIKVLNIPMSSDYLGELLDSGIYSRWSNARLNENQVYDYDPIKLIISKQTYDMYSKASEPIREKIYNEFSDYLHKHGLLNTPEAIELFKSVALEFATLRTFEIPEIPEMFPFEHIMRSAYNSWPNTINPYLNTYQTEDIKLARLWYTLINAADLVIED